MQAISPLLFEKVMALDSSRENILRHAYPDYDK